MEEMAVQIQSQPIKNIAMAGVHHPASYSFITGNTGKYITTKHNIYQQLMMGIRYFDSRPSDYKNQLVEYHGGKDPSYGASYNTLLRSFSDFFKGYNTLSAYGESPNILPLTNNTFALLYHSTRLFSINNEKKSATELYYRIGEYDPLNRQLKWESEQAYNYGMTPAVVTTNSGQVVEVHKSENKDQLWYTLGKIIDGKPTFDLHNQANYTSGVQPTLAVLCAQDQETILEVHKTEHDNKHDQLWFNHFSIAPDGSELVKLESSKVSQCNGTNPKLLTLPGKQKSLLFYSNQNKDLVYVVASLDGGKVTFSSEQLILKPAGEPIEREIAVCLSNNDNNVVLSYTQFDGQISTRAYIDLAIATDYQLSVVKKTTFDKNYPTWNAQSAALFSTGDSQLLSLEADTDLLHNIWYQPLSMAAQEFKLLDIDSTDSAKKEEFVVMSLTHSKLTTPQYSQLCDLVKHFLANKVVKDDGSIDIETAPLANLLSDNKQMIIYFKDLDDMEAAEKAIKYDVLWPCKNNFSSPWHGRKKLDKEYFNEIYNTINLRNTSSYANQVYVLQTHLTDNSEYNSVLDWNEQYTPISDSYLLSQQPALIKHNVNIIENNKPAPFLVDYCCQLNGIKYLNRLAKPKFVKPVSQPVV